MSLNDQSQFKTHKTTHFLPLCLSVLYRSLLINLILTKTLIFFFRFDDKEMVSGVNNAKSSVQKSIRNSVTENYPFIEPYLDQIIPKKGDLKLVKWYVWKIC